MIVCSTCPRPQLDCLILNIYTFASHISNSPHLSSVAMGIKTFRGRLDKIDRLGRLGRLGIMVAYVLNKERVTALGNPIGDLNYDNM